jgi:hypothetical protein
MEQSNAPTFYHISTPIAAPKEDPDRFVAPYSLMGDDQGKQLETNLARLLMQIYSARDIFVAPFGATEATKDREFIDLVAVDGNGLLLIEAKAISVTGKGQSETTAKRVGRISKKIEKALKQLCGAHRGGLKEGHITLQNDAGQRKIRVGAGPINLVVLLGDVHPDIVTPDLTNRLLELGEQHEAGIHIMDLHGLAKRINQCNNAGQLGHLLTERWKTSCKARTIWFDDERLA